MKTINIWYLMTAFKVRDYDILPSWKKIHLWYNSYISAVQLKVQLLIPFCKNYTLTQKQTIIRRISSPLSLRVHGNVHSFFGGWYTYEVLLVYVNAWDFSFTGRKNSRSYEGNDIMRYVGSHISDSLLGVLKHLGCMVLCSSLGEMQR